MLGKNLGAGPLSWRYILWEFDEYGKSTLRGVIFHLVAWVTLWRSPSPQLQLRFTVLGLNSHVVVGICWDCCWLEAVNYSHVVVHQILVGTVPCQNQICIIGVPNFKMGRFDASLIKRVAV